jgi:O-antigen/teichoic acid export membrane protein
MTGSRTDDDPEVEVEIEAAEFAAAGLGSVGRVGAGMAADLEGAPAGIATPAGGESAAEATHAERETTRQIRGSSLLLIGRTISLGINFLTQVLIVRALTKTDYGAFSYALSIVALGQMIITLGLDRGASRFLSMYEEQEDHDRLLGTLVGVSGIILGLGTLLILGVYLFQGLIAGTLTQGPNALQILLIMILLAPIQAFDQLLTGLLTVFASPRSIFFRKYILAPVLRLAVVAVLILADTGVWFLAVGYVAAGALGIALYVVILWQVLERRGMIRKLRSARMKIPGREILVFAVPLVTTDIVYAFMNTSDAILLEHFKGLDSVAAWRVVQPAAGLNQVVMQSFALLFTPAAARLFARQDRVGVGDLYWRTAIWMAVISYPLFALTFSLADVITVTLYGHRYESSAIYMAMLSFGYYFSTALGFNGLTMRIFGIVRFIIVVNVLSAIVNVALNLLLIPPLGALGAALGTTATLVVFNILKQLGLARGTGISFLDPRHIRVYAIIAVTSIALGAVSVAFRPPLIVQLGLAGLASLAVLGLNRRSLQIGQTFPEIVRLPFGRWFA